MCVGKVRDQIWQVRLDTTCKHIRQILRELAHKCQELVGSSDEDKMLLSFCGVLVPGLAYLTQAKVCLLKGRHSLLLASVKFKVNLGDGSWVHGSHRSSRSRSRSNLSDCHLSVRLR